MMEKEKQKILNLDQMVELFREAQAEFGGGD
jgi:hypothetical protein